MQNILTHLVARQALRYGSRTAVGQTDGRTVTYTSWTGFAGRVEAMACAMEAMGVKEQECIGEYTANRETLLVTDFAAFANRAVPVPVYATSTPEQLAYIVRDAGIRLLFVGSAEQYAAARTVQRTAGIELRIVTYEDVTPEPDDTQTVTFEALLQRGREASPATREAVAARRRAATEADLAAIIYTSGTTGEPKGAMLPHSCFNAAIIKHRERLSMLSEADTSVSFLPMSHIF